MNDAKESSSSECNFSTEFQSPQQMDWLRVQDSLKGRVITEDDFKWRLPTGEKEGSCEILKYVGGVDLSFSKDDSSIACGTLVVLDLQTHKVVYEDSSIVRLQIPYVPGFLAFREAPVLLELLDKMKNNAHRFYPHRRSCCCCCCLFITFFIVTIILLAAIAGAIFWVLYRPQRPSFSVSTLQVSQFNLTSTKLASKFNLSVVARNPNKKISFFYDPINISFNSDDIDIGDGLLPAFMHDTKNTTTLKTVVSSSGKNLDDSAISNLRSKLKNKKTLPLEIKLDTKVKVKAGSLKTKKVGIRVKCDGIKITVPSGKTPTKATTSDVKCKVDLRIKIWKWTF